MLISAYTGAVIAGAVKGGLITAFDHAPRGTLDLHDGMLVASDQPGLGVDARSLLSL